MDLDASAAGEEDPGAAVDAPAPPGPAAYVSRTPRTAGSVPEEAAEEHLRLPHERDQDLDRTDEKTSPVIRQAARDIERGLVDTDMRATPGLDAQQRALDVPGPGGQTAQQRTTPPRRPARKS